MLFANINKELFKLIVKNCYLRFIYLFFILFMNLTQLRFTDFGIKNKFSTPGNFIPQAVYKFFLSIFFRKEIDTVGEKK
ncbi:hypothetical protein D3C86_2000450 [compost metagenome]